MIDGLLEGIRLCLWLTIGALIPLAIAMRSPRP